VADSTELTGLYQIKLSLSSEIEGSQLTKTYSFLINIEAVSSDEDAAAHASASADNASTDSPDTGSMSAKSEIEIRTKVSIPGAPSLIVPPLKEE